MNDRKSFCIVFGGHIIKIVCIPYLRLCSAFTNSTGALKKFALPCLLQPHASLSPFKVEKVDDDVGISSARSEYGNTQQTRMTQQ